MSLLTQNAIAKSNSVEYECNLNEKCEHLIITDHVETSVLKGKQTQQKNILIEKQKFVIIIERKK